MLCVLAHSISIPGRGFVIYLCDREGLVQPVSGTRLVERLSGLIKFPGLVVLLGTETAEPARELLNAGATTAVGFQGRVTLTTGASFTDSLVRELVRERGRVDRATAAARTSLADRPDWWVPVVFTRTRSARAWYETRAVEGEGKGARPRMAAVEQMPARWEGRRWEPLIDAIRRAECVPILGPGLAEDVLGSTRQIAASWVEQFRLPVPPEDSHDFPRVASALALMKGRASVWQELSRAYRKAVGDRFGDLTRPGDPTDPDFPDRLIREAGGRLRVSDPGEPHRALARLPLPTFLTTNPDGWLPDALSGEGKQPKVGALNWRERDEAVDSVFVDDPAYRPYPEAPWSTTSKGG